MNKDKIKLLLDESIRNVIQKNMTKREREEIYENKFFDIENAFA